MNGDRLKPKGVPGNAREQWLSALAARAGRPGRTGPGPSPLKVKSDHGDRIGAGTPTEESAQEWIARAEAENAALLAEKAKLTREREILQQAAKYFAGETIR